MNTVIDDFFDIVDKLKRSSGPFDPINSYSHPINSFSHPLRSYSHPYKSYSHPLNSIMNPNRGTQRAKVLQDLLQKYI